MRDLLVITPSRGRPERLREMLDTTLSLSEAQTDIAVGLDTDNEGSYVHLKSGYGGGERVHWWSGKRQSLSSWTNVLAGAHLRHYRAFASLGDDHIPQTQGWDRILLDAIDRMGGTGIAYGDDGIMGERLPTAPVISADIVQALGWMALPECSHMCIDLAWKDLGLGADCLAYVPEVTIEHRHWGVGKSLLDATYAEAGTRTPGGRRSGWRPTWRQCGR